MRTMMEEDLQVPVLAVQDAGRERHPPKLELLDHYFFLMLREIGVDDDGEELNVSQLSLFVGENVLLTYHALPCIAIDQTSGRTGWQRNNAITLHTVLPTLFAES